MEACESYRWRAAGEGKSLESNRHGTCGERCPGVQFLGDVHVPDPFLLPPHERRGSLMYTRRITVERSRLLSVCHWDGSLFVGGSQSRISKWSLKSSASEGEMTLERPNPKQRPGGNWSAPWGCCLCLAPRHTLIWCLVALQDEMLASGDSIGLVHVWDTARF